MLKLLRSATLPLLGTILSITSPISNGFTIQTKLTLPSSRTITKSISKHDYMPSSRSSSPSTKLHERNNNRYDKELEQQAEFKAREKPMTPGSGVGETAAGAILGGLVLGPFGALFGASIGSSLGSSRAVDQAKKEELDRMGITEEMLDSAREMGTALERGVEGLKATQDSLRTQQNFAARLDADAERVYDEAKDALGNSDEERAKELLLKRVDIQEKLKKTLINCAEEKKRLEKMEENVRAIEERAIEMETLMKRNIGAKALMDSSNPFTLADEDPLLQKFRDL